MKTYLKSVLVFILFVCFVNFGGVCTNSDNNTNTTAGPSNNDDTTTAGTTTADTTVAGGDTTAPAVVSTVPTTGATNVAVNSPVSVTFSEDMNPQTINTTTFTVTGSTVPGTVTYSNKVATFTPTNNLDYNKTYTGTVTTGATDTAGNPIANNHTWQFTTAQQQQGLNMANYAGTWLGSWAESTYGMFTDSASAVITVNSQSQTAQIVLDVNGIIFNLPSDPVPVTLNGASSGTNVTVTGTDPITFGNVSMTINSAGNITGTMTNVPSPDVNRLEFTGTITAQTIVLNITVFLDIPQGPVNTIVGTLTLNLQP
ncbi:MAG: Ig-like domain-containing protein [bacterium]